MYLKIMKMFIKFILLSVCLLCVCGSGIYHENTKVLFKPDMQADYFGYSVTLNPHGLIVGAPKSTNKMIPGISSGEVFNCSFSKLESSIVMCSTLSRNSLAFRQRLPNVFFKDDMWLGGSVASLADDKLLICAPRSLDNSSSNNHLYAHGACYVRTPTKDNLLLILSDKQYQGFRPSDDVRPEYKIVMESSRQLTFFANGQAGMSVKSIANDSFIIGAPGLLQCTGGIIHYVYNYEGRPPAFRRDTVTNTYFTKELGPDDYFGYSVDSGVFQPHGITLHVGGAPRSSRGYGQVLIINQPLNKPQRDPLDVVAKITGPQLGAYFGASLCCVDIDGDGAADLLVGAPNYVNKDGGLPFDQGAVFVYMTKQKNKSFILEQAGEVTGSGASGARFGTAIANLGDVDGDGFNDVAIAAPWEDDGSGAVYIYRGTSKGLKTQYIQKLVAEGTKAFGISISNGMDVDNNNCNDLAIGAPLSSSVYLYRCVPTITVTASIKAPNVLSLPSNLTSFIASFCITADNRPRWPDVEAAFMVKISIDEERTTFDIGTSNLTSVTTISPGNIWCIEKVIQVKPSADLSKPILIKFYLEPHEILKNDSKEFNLHAARVSEDSVLYSSSVIQLSRDCGSNKYCTPWLVMTLTALENPYIPGASEKFGTKLTIVNKAKEPAYGAKVNITLPATPKRLPSPCSLDDLVMTCEVPEPLLQNEKVSWDIELQYKYNLGNNIDIMAELYDEFHRNISEDAMKEVMIEVTPKAVFNVVGKSLPNDTITVPNTFIDVGVSKFYDADKVSFIHHFEITNLGPSDWPSLDVQIILPEMAIMSTKIKGCTTNSTEIFCTWYLAARDSKIINLPLQLDFRRFGNLEQTTVNVTTEIVLEFSSGNTNTEITTTIMLDAAPLLWPIILAVLGGIILFAITFYLLYRCGFFSRPKREGFKELTPQPGPSGHPSVSEDAAQEIPLSDVNLN